jgi:hypothetical protein
LLTNRSKTETIFKPRRCFTFNLKYDDEILFLDKSDNKEFRKIAHGTFLDMLGFTASFQNIVIGQNEMINMYIVSRQKNKLDMPLKSNSNNH